MSTVKQGGIGNRVVIKRSIFIPIIKPVKTVDEANGFIDSIRQEHVKATHVVNACRIGMPVQWEDCNDDGEPKGTAGPPIMKYLQGHDLTNIAVVVVRYYGGIKLGPGGLMRAYTSSVASLVEAIGTEPVL